jgi:hypothetical protein
MARASLTAGGTVAVLFLVFAGGCVHMPTFGGKEAPPVAPVTRTLGTWENRVVYAQDITRGGRPTPGIAGRLFLFSGDSGFPVLGDGCARVELYDVTNLPPDQVPEAALERWDIDKHTLKTLFAKDDFLGWGYTLFLPWSTHKPSISKVRLVVTYWPEKGVPLFAPPTTISLGGSGVIPVRHSTQPASLKPAPARPVSTPAAPIQPTRIEVPAGPRSPFAPR